MPRSLVDACPIGKSYVFVDGALTHYSYDRSKFCHTFDIWIHLLVAILTSSASNIENIWCPEIYARF